MTWMAVVIRAAVARDVPAMHAIRCAVRENRLSDPRRVTEEDYLPYVEASSIWAAVDPAGKMLGFAAIDRTEASIWALFVDPDAEGTGVGRALHDAMLAWAAEQDLDRLSLFTAAGTRAERFYAKAGWRETARSETEVRFERQAP